MRIALSWLADMSTSAAVRLPESEPAPRPRLQVCPAPAAPARLERRALRAALTEMFPVLKRRALRWAGAAEAEDLAQEALLRALSARDAFGSEQHLRAWLFTVLRNLFISRRRRHRSEVLARSKLEGARAGSLQRESAAPFLTPSVERALAALPPSFGDVVRLVDLEDHSYAEASHALGIPVGTVMSRLFRARQRLAEALAEAAVIRVP
jgi:RNA polymerase sigma-70 factor (ECF subfamily)